ncbi:Ku protein [Lutibaculum baratangense]|uniref:Non-homologous end joining protein Ku n=1 Tax=Lutibaculum baratangense AMV1 TaxID=631454 RepID=V4RJ69_9HYPH|nr:Ku protein [Lutibaculum baratangense]ESR23315.1 Ku domain protein [Lutibaculum baratangense AMV1]
MATGRPVWSGHIRLSLVSLPVKLYTATESKAKLSFRQIHEPSGKPIRYEKTVPGVGAIDSDEIIKGFEIEKDEYVLLTQEEIDEMKIEAKKTLELVQFVDQTDIDPIYFDRPYYVVPDDELAEDAFRVVRDALRRQKKVGLGQIVMRGRSYIAALKPCSKGMLLETLRFEDELRRSDAYFAPISDQKSDDQLLNLAEELIERNSRPFDPSVFKDQYTAALRDLIQKKSKGKSTKVSADEGPDAGSNVVNLMDALKQSLNQGKPGSASKPKSAGASKAAAKTPSKAKAKSADAGKEAEPDKPAGSKSGTSRSRRSKAA